MPESAPHPVTRRPRTLASLGLFVLLLALGLSPQAEAAARKLGVLSDNYPYSFRAPSGEMDGFAVELMRSIERDMGLTFEWVVGGTADIQAAAKRGDVDAMLTFAQSEERAQWVDFSVPYLDMHNSIIVRKGTPGIGGLEDLRGRKVMVHRNSLGDLLLRQHHLEDSIVYVASVEESILRLGRGENDALIGTRLTVLSHAAKHGINNLTPGGPPLLESPVRYCFAVRENDKALLSLLNEGLALAHQRGDFDRIYRKWFGHLEPPRITALQVATAITIALSLILLVTWWAFLRQRRLKRELAKQADHLRASEERYRTLFESSHEGILLVDRQDLRLREANATANQLLELEPGAIGRTLSTLGRRGQALAGLLEGSGSLGGRASELHFSGRSDPQWIRVSASQIQDNLLVFLSDVSDARVAEERLRRNERMLQHNQKLEAIGTLASGIAHDFNNVLTTILGNIELVLLDLEERHPLRPNIQQIQVSANRAGDLVRQILTFSRRSEAKRETVDLAAVVEEVLRFIRSVAPSSVEISFRKLAPVSSLQGDATQIHQVVTNLCTNALHAVRGKNGILALGLEQILVTPEMVAVQPALRTGEFLRLSVRDNGSGMAPEVLSHIFEPFFTTKAPGEGTGLGLSVVHGIVQAHQGCITVYSEVGVGTVFDLYLPADSRPGVTASRSPFVLAELPRGGGHEVLYVDDEPAIARTLAELLERLGYRVTTFSRAEEAAAHVMQAPSRYLALVTDLNMPRLSGLELAAKVRATGSTLPVILTSGFVSEQDKARADQLGVSRILTKPLSIQTLACCLAEVRNEKPPGARAD